MVYDRAGRWFIDWWAGRGQTDLGMMVLGLPEPPAQLTDADLPTLCAVLEYALEKALEKDAKHAA